jgi:hypothetical protein
LDLAARKRANPRRGFWGGAYGRRLGGKNGKEGEPAVEMGVAVWPRGSGSARRSHEEGNEKT